MTKKSGRLIKILLTILALVGQFSSSAGKAANRIETSVSINDRPFPQDSIIYKTDDLVIHRISPGVYVHETFLQTESFGKVTCNGMIVLNGNQAIIFDSPSTIESSRKLIEFITGKLNCKINAVVATHFHADCVGGLKAFHDHRIPSYANQQTIDILKRMKYESSAIPQKGFERSLTLKAGKEKVYAEFIGEGHTKDNIIGYFPKGNAMFGGCLIKEAGANKGNLDDANVLAWSETVSKLRQKYPSIDIVIPGHGKSGGIELLDYSIKLFR
jgi:metallo-beta-lactamase class B